ncbi:carbohydrate ABC transporter permease [Streptomyces sp. NBC_00385]|uniref:carbohydrate ABC transporter permease n=1 Tax=Streptomyces sp. NBC_00385 TaxID=2975733 RepID=UPI002DDC203A|nr:carbohydrate ABC transporter permease [Streptomyces sp. NBC_00385]WRZ02686.1 carbohydrate ABC transporter permease [Streptomyces sp. NBC_00385]
MTTLPSTILGKERRHSGRRRRIGPTLALTVISLFTVAPLLAVVVLALSPEDAPTLPHAIPDSLTLDNITRIFDVGEFPLWLWNSFVYSAVSVVVILLTASMAAYALVRKRFPGRNALLWSIVATLMVPMQATLIPTFILVSRMEGVNTLWGLTLPTLANAQAVFLIRQFVRDLPDEIFDAARIDGAGEWRTFVQILLPLIRPILATLAIFVFLWHWNDLLWPLVVGQTDEARTLTVGLATLNTETVSTAGIMSAALVSFIPCLVIFMVLQRHIVAGIAAGGIKG